MCVKHVHKLSLSHTYTHTQVYAHTVNSSRIVHKTAVTALFDPSVASHVLVARIQPWMVISYDACRKWQKAKCHNPQH